MSTTLKPTFSRLSVKAYTGEDVAAVEACRGPHLSVEGSKKAREIVFCPRTNRIGTRNVRCGCVPCFVEKRWEACEVPQYADTPRFTSQFDPATQTWSKLSRAARRWQLEPDQPTSAPAHTGAAAAADGATLHRRRLTKKTTVAELKSWLSSLGLPTTGLKMELYDRLVQQPGVEGVEGALQRRALAPVPSPDASDEPPEVDMEVETRADESDSDEPPEVDTEMETRFDDDGEDDEVDEELLEKVDVGEIFAVTVAFHGEPEFEFFNIELTHGPEVLQVETTDGCKKTYGAGIEVVRGNFLEPVDEEFAPGLYWTNVSEYCRG